MEVMDITEKERMDTKMATLYELRLIITSGEKKEYTADEIVELLDKIAMAKDQQQRKGKGRNTNFLTWSKMLTKQQNNCYD